MHKPDPVETILARLMPPGLSEEGQRGIEEMLDELAGPSAGIVTAAPQLTVIPWNRRVIAGGIAAAILAVAVVLPMVFRSSPSPLAAGLSDTEIPAEFVLVSESDRVESTTD